jgi:hypothetical protein
MKTKVKYDIIKKSILEIIFSEKVGKYLQMDFSIKRIS